MELIVSDFQSCQATGRVEFAKQANHWARMRLLGADAHKYKLKTAH